LGTEEDTGRDRADVSKRVQREWKVREERTERDLIEQCQLDSDLVQRLLQVPFDRALLRVKLQASRSIS
jgi:hypothetical protein